jgi:hypothetical protein
MMSLGVLLRTPASNSLMKTVAVTVYVFASAQKKNHENESARPWLKGCLCSSGRSICGAADRSTSEQPVARRSDSPRRVTTVRTVGRSRRTERSLGRMRSRKNFNICTSPAFASSIALGTSSPSSAFNNDSATRVVLFLNLVFARRCLSETGDRVADWARAFLLRLP